MQGKSTISIFFFSFERITIYFLYKKIVKKKSSRIAKNPSEAKHFMRWKVNQYVHHVLELRMRIKFDNDEMISYGPESSFEMTSNVIYE